MRTCNLEGVRPETSVVRLGSLADIAFDGQNVRSHDMEIGRMQIAERDIM